MIGLKRGAVRLVPYQPAWKELFREEAARLRQALGDRALFIEHVGSTAIEGMDAKPIIDILIAARDLDDAMGLVPPIEALGYKHKEDDDVPERIFFRRGPPPGRRTHHLSLAEPTSGYWQRHVLFRDYLLAHPETAQEYRQLKRKLASRYPEDRASYTAGKRGFVERILQLAKSET